MFGSSMFSYASNKINLYVCSKCRAPMTFISAKPARIGFDLRSFECPNCKNVETVTSETLAHRWTNADLAPPV